MQFLIHALDSTKEGTLERRMSVRPKHLEHVAGYRENGHVIGAGGILNDNGDMIGSFLVMEFDSRAELDEYIAGEPYVVNGVWEDVRVESVNVVIRDGQKVR